MVRDVSQLHRHGLLVLPGISFVSAAAVPDGDDAYGLVDAVGAQSGEPSAQLVTEVRVAFEFTDRVEYRGG